MGLHSHPAGELGNVPVPSLEASTETSTGVDPETEGQSGSEASQMIAICMAEATVTVLVAGTATPRVGVNVQVILLSPGTQVLHLAVNVEKLRRWVQVVVVCPIQEDKVLAAVPVHPTIVVSCVVIIVANKVIPKQNVGTWVAQATSLGLIIGRTEKERGFRGVGIGTDALSPVIEEVGTQSLLSRVPGTGVTRVVHTKPSRVGNERNPSRWLPQDLIAIPKRGAVVTNRQDPGRN